MKPATSPPLAPPPPWHIGLTGGIGSGKSTVAQHLVALGACLIDSDAIARELTAPGGEALPALEQAFGPELFDDQGALRRDRLRARVFADPVQKARLEALLHPLIRQRGDALAAASIARVRVFDVPLLVESGVWRDRVHRVWVVDCPVQTQIRRVSQRPGWTADAARAVIAQQASRAARLAVADAVIHNDTDDLPALHAQLDRLWAQLGPDIGLSHP